MEHAGYLALDIQVLWFFWALFTHVGIIQGSDKGQRLRWKMLYSAQGSMDMAIMDLDITDKKKVRDEQEVTIQTLG